MSQEKKRISNYVSFGKMQDLAGLSMVQLGKIVQEKNLQMYFIDRDERGVDIFKPFNVSMNGFQDWLAHEGFFDPRDLTPIKKELPELKLFFENENILSNSSVVEELKENSSNQQHRIAELERQVQNLRQENEILNAGIFAVVPQEPTCENRQPDQDSEQRLAELKASNAELKASNLDLQSRLDAALGGRGRWRPSCLALFEAMEQVIGSGRNDWTQAEFLNVAREIYKASGAPQDPLDEAERLVWSALPRQFKAGPGNPKNKGNPTKE